MSVITVVSHLYKIIIYLYLQIVSQFKIEKMKVAKSIAQRKAWKKFGLSSNDNPGPNLATTITAEEVQMAVSSMPYGFIYSLIFPCIQFITAKDEEPNEQEELKKKLMDAQKGQVKCRLCKEDHWTKQCPYKDKLEPLRTSLLVKNLFYKIKNYNIMML